MTNVCLAIKQGRMSGECMIVCLCSHPPFARHATLRQSLMLDICRCDPRGNLDCNLSDREASPQAMTLLIEYNPRMTDGLSWRQ